jgi:hypothetical protein
VRKKVQGRGKNEEGKFDGSLENSTMFPVTCADGLFQFRFDAKEKKALEKKAQKNQCNMADLFTISGELFRTKTRAEIKNLVLSQVSEKTGNNFRSVSQYIKETVIN